MRERNRERKKWREKERERERERERESKSSSGCQFIVRYHERKGGGWSKTMASSSSSCDVTKGSRRGVKTTRCLGHGEDEVLG
jgi:hypothetical protein